MLLLLSSSYCSLLLCMNLWSHPWYCLNHIILWKKLKYTHIYSLILNLFSSHTEHCQNFLNLRWKHLCWFRIVLRLHSKLIHLVDDSIIRFIFFLSIHFLFYLFNRNWLYLIDRHVLLVLSQLLLFKNSSFFFLFLPLFFNSCPFLFLFFPYSFFFNSSSFFIHLSLIFFFLFSLLFFFSFSLLFLFLSCSF